MGYLSWKCAVSKQSIPVPSVEVCDVTLFLADSNVIKGEYDGYGRILGGSDVVNVMDVAKAALIATGNWNPVPTRTLNSFELGVMVGGQEAQRCWKFMYAEAGKEKDWTPPESYTGRLETESDARAWFQKNAIQNAEFQLALNSVKLVKSKLVTNEMSYASLPFSEDCPHQGFFFDHKNQWNEPAYPPGK